MSKHGRQSSICRPDVRTSSRATLNTPLSINSLCSTSFTPVNRVNHRVSEYSHVTQSLSHSFSSSSTESNRTVYKYQVLEPNVPYTVAHRWMNDLVVAKTRRDDPEQKDILFIVQHAPVYTLGKGASLDNVMFDTSVRQPFDVQRIERGGEVTYHGPGQLTVYPIINLKRYKQDLHWYVTQLETVVTHALNNYGISSRIDQEHPGVWVGQNKIAALGCRFSRWVTMHGFALNVTMDVNEGFRRIIPCGIHDRGVSSIQSVVHQQHELLRESQPILTSKTPPIIDINQVADQITASFEQVFNVRVIEDDHVNMFYDASLERSLAEANKRLTLDEVYQGSIDLI